MTLPHYVVVAAAFWSGVLLGSWLSRSSRPRCLRPRWPRVEPRVFVAPILRSSPPRKDNHAD